MPFASNVERTEAVRLVVDTNLMIRALRTPGPARQFFKLAPLTHLLVYHPEQIQELRDVASRPKLAIAPPAVDELIDRVRRYGTIVESELDLPGDCRDPKDNYILAMALAGTAEVILTEDQDLLVLHPWRDIRIMRLFEFLREHPLSET
jgi:putative PIN family toxin of toxin-antitoxin system